MRRSRGSSSAASGAGWALALAACLLVLGAWWMAAPSAADHIDLGEAPDQPAAEMDLDPARCDTGEAATSTSVAEYCSLRRECEEIRGNDHLWDFVLDNPDNGWKEVCDALSDRELLRECQLATDTEDRCRDLHAGLRLECEGAGQGSLSFRFDYDTELICQQWWQSTGDSDDDEDQEGEDAAGGSLPGPGGTGSPWCDVLEDDDSASTSKRRAEESCERTGSLVRFFPESHYGIDLWFGGDVTEIHLGAAQLVATVVWRILVKILSVVLLLLEWAFSFDLLNGADGAMPDIEVILIWIHDDLLGSGWTLAALVAAGLWGIWNGLVRMRTIPTLGGLAATVALMIVGLALIENPRGTVGRVSGWANDASVGALSIANPDDLGDADGGFAGGMQTTFETLVVGPWCVLQFGDGRTCTAEGVPYSEQRRDTGCVEVEADDPILDSIGGGTHFGGDTGTTYSCPESMADQWLQVPSGEERRTLYEYWKENDRSRVAMQEATGAVERFGLVVLIGAGVLGAICLLGYLGLNLVLAAVMVVLLLLAAPLAFLAPAFGEGGRNLFISYGKRLAGAALAKLIFALFLGVVLLIANLITGMDFGPVSESEAYVDHPLPEFGGWYARWLVLTVFWWSVFLKRQQILAFVALAETPTGAGFGLLKAYMGLRMARDVAGMATAPARAALGGLARGTRAATRGGLAAKARRDQARDDAGELDAGEQLRERAVDDVARRHEGDVDTAREVSADQKRKGELDRQLKRARAKRDATTKPAQKRRLNQDIGDLERERGEVADRLDEHAGKGHDGRWAQGVLNRHEDGIDVSENDIRERIGRYERELGDTDPGQDDDEQRELRRLVEISSGRGTREMRAEHRREIKQGGGDRRERWRHERRAARQQRKRDDTRANRRRRGLFR